MAYYVRKLNKKNSLEKIQQAHSIPDVVADVLNEFRISSGELSVWKISDITDINTAILSIAITSEKLDRTDFLLIDEDIVSQCGFAVVQGPSGQQLCDDLENNHYNITNLTVGNIDKCVEIYSKVIDGLDLSKVNKLIPRKTEAEIGQLIHDALSSNKISEDDINPNCLKYINEKNPKILQITSVSSAPVN